jgi:MFS family permease
MAAIGTVASSYPEGADYSPVVESAIRKGRRRLIPFLLLMYVAAFLDRVNVGFAKQHLQDATGMSDAAFAFGASLFFVTYLIFEIPSNFGLARFGAKIWMCRIMVLWGLVSAAMMFVQGNTLFYIIRLLLGAAEAGFFPGVILFLTYWFPARKRVSMLGLFYFGAPLSFVLGGPVSGLLLQMDGVAGLAGWQWMFLLEGLFASAIGVWAYFYLDNGPADAAWLTPEEKTELSAVLAAEDADKLVHGPGSFLASLKDSTVLRFILIYALMQMSIAIVVFYLPSQLGRLIGQTSGLAFGLMVAIPWACALVAVATVPAWSSKLGGSRFWGAASFIVAAIGMAGSASANPVIAVASLCIAVAGLWAVQPIFWQTLTSYLGGVVAVAGIALVNSLGNIGGFISPNVRIWANDTFGSTSAGLYLLAGTTVMAAILMLTIRREEAPVADPLRRVAA